MRHENPQQVVVFGAAGWVGRAVLANFQGRHRLRAADHGAQAWTTYAEVDGTWADGEVLNCDIADYEQVRAAIDGMDAVIHTAVLGTGYQPGDDDPWLINVKGLWNVLDVARDLEIHRVVHIGSAPVVHPEGRFFDSEVRRTDGSLYAVNKRLQEEMCRQFHEAFGMSIVVLRPCSIVDSRLGMSKYGKPLQQQDVGSVCRHDLAQACRLAIEVEDIGFEVLHIAGLPQAEQHCNVARGRQVLGLEYEADLLRFGAGSSPD